MLPTKEKDTIVKNINVSNEVALFFQHDFYCVSMKAFFFITFEIKPGVASIDFTIKKR